MRLLIEEYQKRIATLEKDIKGVYTKLESFKEVSTFGEQEERIKGHIDLLVKELITTKEQKFLRDKVAFNEGKAYLWQQHNSQGRQQKKNNPKS